MAAIIVEHELFQSCRILFGSEMQLNRDFLEYLQPAGIKSAYRKKAFETHPDMLADKGPGCSLKSGDLFRVVQQAYETLTGYLVVREKGGGLGPSLRSSGSRYNPHPPEPEAGAWAKHNGGRSGHSGSSNYTDETFDAWHNAKRWHARQYHQTHSRQQGSSVYSGRIPTHRLLFGRYLNYAGVINSQIIIKALVWQRNRRPRLGEIGQQFGWLTDQDILHILRNRVQDDPFGVSAVKLGLLTSAQLRVLVLRQRCLQKKFGEYLTRHGIVTPDQLSTLISQFYAHNRSVSNR